VVYAQPAPVQYVEPVEEYYEEVPEYYEEEEKEPLYVAPAQ
jgi:hypothetical protein